MDMDRIYKYQLDHIEERLDSLHNSTREELVSHINSMYKRIDTLEICVRKLIKENNKDVDEITLVDEPI